MGGHDQHYFVDDAHTKEIPVWILLVCLIFSTLILTVICHWFRKFADPATYASSEMDRKRKRYLAEAEYEEEVLKLRRRFVQENQNLCS